MLEAHFAPNPPVKFGQKFSRGTKRLVVCRKLSVSAYSEDPVLTLCRKLVEEGHGDECLTVYRGDAPAMFISSIRKAAKLTVKEDANSGPRFAPYVLPSFPAKAPGAAPVSALADAE
ncbi:hypothetical protein [Azospirillum sp. sgz301742]